jgi:tungstate transport system permease protein
MKFIGNGLSDAVHLLLHPDQQLLDVLRVTLEVALWSTLLALVIGLPIGLLLGLGRFRGRRAGLSVANAGMGFPPVVVGLIVALLLFREAPFGGLHLIYTVRGVIVAQTLLSLPLVVALSAAAVQAVPVALLDQARALGASRPQVGALALREARIGVIAAAIAALGSALSEVGAVVLVGGNITGQTQTLASAVLVEVSAGDYGRAVALGAMLLGLILVIAAGLTLYQQNDARWALRRAS